MLSSDSWVGAHLDIALVAQVSKPAGSPISKSADYPKFKGSPRFNGLRVWKPAIQQTWKSAALCVRSVETGAADEKRWDNPPVNNRRLGNRRR